MKEIVSAVEYYTTITISSSSSSSSSKPIIIIIIINEDEDACSICLDPFTTPDPPTLWFILTSIENPNFDKLLVGEELTIVRGPSTSLIVVLKRDMRIHLGFMEEGLASKIVPILDNHGFCHNSNLEFSCTLINGYKEKIKRLPLFLGISAKKRKFTLVYYQLLLKGCPLTLWDDEIMEKPRNLYEVVDLFVEKKRWLEPLNTIKNRIIIKVPSLNQLEDLGWLHKMENTKMAAPFWLWDGDGYFNVLSNQKRRTLQKDKGGMYFYDNRVFDTPLSMVYLIGMDKIVDNPPKTSITDIKSPTLIICLSEDIFCWEITIAVAHLELGTLKCFTNSDNNREEKFEGCDIVFTSYDLVYDAKIQESNWSRVILDNGYDFTNSSLTGALKKLKAKTRWVLFRGPNVGIITGELAQILSFIRIEPIGDDGYWEKLIREGTEEGNVKGLLNLQMLVGLLTLRRTAISGCVINNQDGTRSHQARSTCALSLLN